MYTVKVVYDEGYEGLVDGGGAALGVAVGGGGVDGGGDDKSCDGGGARRTPTIGLGAAGGSFVVSRQKLSRGGRLVGRFNS